MTAWSPHPHTRPRRVRATSTTMEKNVLQSIAGITIYPLISFVIFFLFFLALLVYVLVANRQHISTMSQLPLSDDGTQQAHLDPNASC